MWLCSTSLRCWRLVPPFVSSAPGTPHVSWSVIQLGALDRGFLLPSQEALRLWDRLIVVRQPSLSLPRNGVRQRPSGRTQVGVSCGRRHHARLEDFDDGSSHWLRSRGRR